MNGVFVLIPIMLMGVAVTGIISATILKLQRLKLEEAKRRDNDPAELGDMVTRIESLEQSLAEVQDRLDFTERLLAQSREKQQLPPPAGEG